MMITAKFVRPNAGYDCDKEQVAVLGLELNRNYHMNHISIGQSHSSVWLQEFDGVNFNSVHFDFYENGKRFDIYRDERFSQYVY